MSRFDKVEELLAGNIGACPFRHHDGEALGGMEAQAAAAWRMQKSSERRGQTREEEEDGMAKSRTSTRRAVLKGANATPHLRHQARRVSGTSPHTRACPGETTTHSRDTLDSAGYGPAESTSGHDGTVMSVMLVEMPASITVPTFTRRP
jgi:hypothetical protein